MNPSLADWHTSDRDGMVLEQLGVHRILQFPAVGLYLGVSVPCICADGIQPLNPST